MFVRVCTCLSRNVCGTLLGRTSGAFTRLQSLLFCCCGPPDLAGGAVQSPLCFERSGFLWRTRRLFSLAIVENFARQWFRLAGAPLLNSTGQSRQRAGYQFLQQAPYHIVVLRSCVDILVRMFVSFLETHYVCVWVSVLVVHLPGSPYGTATTILLKKITWVWFGIILQF